MNNISQQIWLPHPGFVYSRGRSYLKIKVMKNLKLAQLEQQVLESLISQLYAEPGYSDVDHNDISHDIKVDVKSVRGALGSLVRKDIIGIDINDSGYRIIYLNQSYWYLHPEWSKEMAQ